MNGNREDGLYRLSRGEDEGQGGRVDDWNSGRYETATQPLDPGCWARLNPSLTLELVEKDTASRRKGQNREVAACTGLRHSAQRSIVTSPTMVHNERRCPTMQTQEPLVWANLLSAALAKPKAREGARVRQGTTRSCRRAPDHRRVGIAQEIGAKV